MGVCISKPCGDGCPLRCFLLAAATLVAPSGRLVKQPPIVEGSQQVKCTRVEGLEILPWRCGVLQVFYVYAQQCPGSQLGSAGWHWCPWRLSRKFAGILQYIVRLVPWVHHLAETQPSRLRQSTRRRK
ncbi:hypothetical protein GWK47_013647 [Chionoecetes opilio]|uniref:Uncharacterized protein n=1 Tax=Chionoecetes opilio TaxID=41210 RepID=A0A8J4XV97_CHIOP|nr:hypothetical protein GWK47_013647 [Chionoecetes opilio]